MNVIPLCNLIFCFGKYNSPYEPQSHILKSVVIQSPNDRRLESRTPDPFTFDGCRVANSFVALGLQL